MQNAKWERHVTNVNNMPGQISSFWWYRPNSSAECVKWHAEKKVLHLPFFTYCYLNVLVSNVLVRWRLNASKSKRALFFLCESHFTTEVVAGVKPHLQGKTWQRIRIQHQKQHVTSKRPHCCWQADGGYMAASKVQKSDLGTWKSGFVCCMDFRLIQFNFHNN